MNEAKYIAKVLQIIQETPKVKRLILGYPTKFPFAAGQFVTLYFPQFVDQNGFTIERSYSIAEYSEGKIDEFESIIEICFSLKIDGLITPFLWDLKEGDILESSGPKGDFILRNSMDVDRIVFVCTGTGIVPFMAMISELIAEKYTGKIHLIAGNRFHSDTLYAQKIQDWVSANKVEVATVFSKQEDAALKGYVHQVYQSMDLQQAHVYVCGWSEMCTETRRNLKAMGLTRKQYFFEQYD